jgi:hypothetical protein
MGRLLRNSRRYLALFAVCLVLFILCGILWLLHPWIPQGQAIHWKTFVADGYEFQVWQRKNPYILEPFATGLFLKGPASAGWKVYCLDFEDVYSPSVKVRRKESRLQVFHNGKLLGTFDERFESFRLSESGQEFPVSEIQGSPPGKWWLNGGP